MEYYEYYQTAFDCWLSAFMKRYQQNIMEDLWNIHHYGIVIPIIVDMKMAD
jgi:hypothetical protein